MAGIKKLLNKAEDCVFEASEGLLKLDTRIKRLGALDVLVRADIEAVKLDAVTILTGGGSGHEPAHAGYIGAGMLSCAVLGNVFASPAVTAILAGIKCIAGPKGVLLIVKNYTGDRLNFGMAMERAKQLGIKAMMVVVADDVALPEGKGITGGRGIAGTVFVHKVAGAMAARGASLEEVHAGLSACPAKAAAKQIGSLGVALTTCTLPGALTSSNRLSAPGLIEVGMGIHGESGREQVTLPQDDAAKTVAGILIDGILARLKLSGSQVRVAVLVNNLGALSAIEVLVMSNEILSQLQLKGFTVVRAYVGAFMTALEMSGLSLSIFPAENEQLSLLDAPTSAPAWTTSVDLTDAGAADRSIPLADSDGQEQSRVGGGLVISEEADGLVRAVCERLVSIEPKLTEMDTICGDGDCGLVVKKGALFVVQQIQALRETAKESRRDIDATEYLQAIASAVSSSMGGTSGALLELFFTSMSSSFRGSSSGSSSSSMDGAGQGVLWANALQEGVAAIKFYGGADVGMRTMLDALVPAVEAFSQVVGGSYAPAAVQLAAEKAATGADSTKEMDSLAGRANYVTKENMKGVPDPGAVAVAEAFAALAEAFK